MFPINKPIISSSHPHPHPRPYPPISSPSLNNYLTTMYPSFLRFTLTLTFIFTLLSPILCTQAPTTNLTPTTIPIAVGLHGALSFSPNSTSASVGDILEFRFFNGSAPHSVVSGPFGTPCLPGSGGFFSGYLEGVWFFPFLLFPPPKFTVTFFF